MKHIAFLSVKWMSVGLGMLSLLLSVASCGDKEYGDAMNEAQLMNDIEVNVGSSLPLAVGMDFVLDYKPVPENVTNPEITLTSSDENVVSVSQDGRVTAKMIGKAYINLSQSTAFETLKTIEVQVMPVATAIELENVELFEGTNKKVIVNVTPSDGYNVFDWKSDNEEVATVADDGTITGKKPGTANISVSSQDGSQLTATAVVTVKEVIPIDKITLSEPGYDMMIGDKTLINCLLEPIDASVGLLSWSTTNDRVATVDADGLVTAVGAGEAEIIAQDPLSGLSASIAVKVVGEGVVSLSLSYVRNQDELKALGWGFGQTPASVNFDTEGMTVNMSLQSNSKYRADLKMASNDRPVVLNIGAYRYLAFRMDVPGNGSLKLDTNKGDYGNNPTGVLAEDSQVIYYDLQAKPYFPTDAPSDKLTTFQLKIADVTVQPYSYKVYWVRTFKTLEDLKVYVEKENNK
ncbi:Ig-like domain-containing protein [Bacteroides thetaiotaomicron]|jgi:hypothetical protein|uniref:Bacterial surface proteins containing Ig-like domains n=1 Tax=Bacteroides thetaiotaomicron TaxID=818 RepID=A0A174N0I2_BACT4|nr:Ig-like domain-containing protein [Bacteroides thetaiotaomicron]MCS2649182.1 Ig-like domain-containing protein [Bacteroides thetaiotaomicron]CUP41186.1 Bacterial surface proteins containing Ig-like domains [Bacteroides thetaiotaomicron]